MSGAPPTAADTTSQYLRDLRIYHEYCHLAANKLGSVYVLPDLSDMLTLHGVVFPRQALYAGGTFKFKISLPPDYPHSQPTDTFVTRVFSPLVDETVRTLCWPCAPTAAPCPMDSHGV